MPDTFKVFEIDDSFDPLEDLHVEEPEEQDSDYQVPDPDAEEQAPIEEAPAPELPVSERMEHLFKGMPGQKVRLCTAVKLCRSRLSLDDLEEQLRSEFPNDKSVYDAGRVAQLLERAGALEGEMEQVEESDAASARDAAAPDAATAQEASVQEAATQDATSAQDAPDVQDVTNNEEGYIELAPASVTYYTATPEGIEVAEQNLGLAPIVETISESEGRYRHIYRIVLEHAAREGGCTPKDIDAAIEGDPVLEEPRRFSTYFLRKLETADAIRWRDAWVATDSGKDVLSTEFE